MATRRWERKEGEEEHRKLNHKNYGDKDEWYKGGLRLKPKRGKGKGGKMKVKKYKEQFFTGKIGVEVVKIGKRVCEIKKRSEKRKKEEKIKEHGQLREQMDNG